MINDRCELPGMFGSQQGNSTTEKFVRFRDEKHFEVCRFREMERKFGDSEKMFSCEPENRVVKKVFLKKMK